MIKTIVSSQMLVAKEIFTANEIGSIKSGDKSIEKYEKLKTEKLSKNQKLSKSRNLKGKKLSKFQKLAKKNKPSFLILNARTAFNHLQLVFTKALIF